MSGVVKNFHREEVYDQTFLFQRQDGPEVKIFFKIMKNNLLCDNFRVQTWIFQPRRIPLFHMALKFLVGVK